MWWKSLTKYPAFTIGMLMVVILLFDLSRRGMLPTLPRQIIPSSCQSASVMLKKRIPETWRVQCENNNMTVTIHSQLEAKKYPHLSKVLYRELANNLQFIAQNGLNESLERTLIIRVHVIHPKMQINAITEGKHLAKLAGLDRPEFIAEHLKATVRVKENHTESNLQNK